MSIQVGKTYTWRHATDDGGPISVITIRQQPMHLGEGMYWINGSDWGRPLMVREDELTEVSSTAPPRTP